MPVSSRNNAVCQDGTNRLNKNYQTCCGVGHGRREIQLRNDAVIQIAPRSLTSYAACGYGIRNTTTGTRNGNFTRVLTTPLASRTTSKAFATSVISASGHTLFASPTIPLRPATTVSVAQTFTPIGNLSDLGTSAQVCLGFDIYAAVTLIIVLVIMGVRSLRKSGARKQPTIEEVRVQIAR